MVRQSASVYALVAFLIVAAPVAPLLAQTIEGRRVALLVGINEYQKPLLEDLAYAEADVEAVAAELRTLGFEVRALKGANATRAAIAAAAIELVEGLGKEDLALVMLSGHGAQMDVLQPDGSYRNDAFFCPVDAVDRKPETHYSLSELTDRVLAPNVGRGLVVVDACRNDPNRSRGKGIEGKVVALPEGVALFFSCLKGQRSFEEPSLKHGVFTHCLLEGLRGAAEREGVIDWSALVSHTTFRMSTAEVRAYLPEGSIQQPIAAGGVPFTPLGRVLPKTDALAPTRVPVPATPQKREPAGRGERDDNTLKMPLVYCRAGSFMMGSQYWGRGGQPIPGIYAHEGPQRRVKLTRGFWLAKYEVTQAEWEKVMHSRPWEGQEGVLEDPRAPATHINWDEAMAFCEKLTSIESEAGRLAEGQRFTLPTEAQWEYACRSSKTTLWAFGDDPSRLSDYAWFLENASVGVDSPSAHPVGKKKPTGRGFHDLHGNVAEWCSDWQGSYNTMPTTDPWGALNGIYRSVRGGAWVGQANELRASFRNSQTPSASNNYVGFRVALIDNGE